MSHAELLARHRKVLPSWLALYYDQPIELVDGKGCRVVDGEGTTYLDFFAGILTTMIGYNPPEVVEAVREQAGRMVHTSTLYLIRRQVELAERVAELSGIPDAKVFFTSSGSRGQRGGAAAGDDGPAQQPGPGPAQQLPRPLLRGHGGHRQPELVGVQLHPGQRQLRPRRLPLPQPVQGPARRPLHRRLRRRPARRDRHHHRRPRWQP